MAVDFNSSFDQKALKSDLLAISRRKKLNLYLSLLCFSGFLDLFGVSIVIPFLPKHLRGLGESYTAVGFVSSIYGFIQFFSAPIIGNLSDKYGRKQILIVSLLTSALSYLLMTTSSLSASIFVVAISRIPPGLLKHSQSLTKAELARSTKALSYFNAASTTGFIVGPPLTGYLLDKFSPQIGYSIAGQVAAAAFFLNAVLVYYLLPNDKIMAKTDSKRYQTIEPRISRWIKNIKSNFTRLTTPPLSYIYSAKFLNSQALFMSRSTYLLYLETELKLSSSALGWLSSVAPFLTVISAPLVTPICSMFSQKSPRLQALCCLLEILSVVLLLTAPNLFVVILSSIPHGLATAVGRVNYTSMSLFFGGGANVGTLIGFDQSVLSFSRTIAPAISGLLMDISLKLPLGLSICLLIPTAIIFHNMCSLSAVTIPSQTSETKTPKKRK